MNTLRSSHHWVSGGARRDRQAAVRSMCLPADIATTIDAHRQRRGPYTVAGTLARALVPAALASRPDLVARYDIELLSVAPELSAVVPNSRQTLTSMALPKERTRFYARLRTRRIANGFVEFVRDSVADRGPLVLVIENVEHADPTDLEFLATLVRRIDPTVVSVVVCSGTDAIPSDGLVSVLRDRAEVMAILPKQGDEEILGVETDDSDLAGQYIDSDGASDDAAERAAYEALEPAERARRHDRRAAQLSERDEQSLRLGAIPYHLENGSDPAGAGAEALYAAEDYCVCMGFYDAVVDYGYRGLAVVDEVDQRDLWWMFAIELGLALSILSRTVEAEALYDRARVLSADPIVHMAAAYSTAMLYTRHNELRDRDERKAKAWLNSAIATASMIEDHNQRAFQSAFYRNGLALVEVNLGEASEALRLVNESIDLLDRELSPDEHRLHRSVLKNNRARVYAGLGRLDDALADYAVVIQEDPNHAEHYLERGNILRRLGRYNEALDDYERALRLSPPFPEIYYNRGDLRMIVDDVDGALADFSYVVELEPEFVDAYVNRAGIYLERGDLDLAYRDAAAGLAVDPDNPYLHVVIGQLHAAREQYAPARAALDRAIECDPETSSAYSARATVAYETGDLEGALADLGRALELSPNDVAVYYNRAFALQRGGRWDEALADLEAAAALAPDDPDVLEALVECRQRVVVPA